MARSISKKMRVCGILSQKYRLHYDSDPGLACRAAKKAVKQRCPWASKPDIKTSCKRRYTR